MMTRWEERDTTVKTDKNALDEKKECFNFSAATLPDIFIYISFETRFKWLQILMYRISVRSFIFNWNISLNFSNVFFDFLSEMKKREKKESERK